MNATWFRRAVGLYALGWSLARLPAHLGMTDRAADRWHPVGVLGPLGLPPDAAIVALAVITPLLAVAFIAGWHHRVVGPATALATLALTTLDSSWGQVFHTENLLALHVLIVGLSPKDSDDAVRLSAWVVAVTYVLAGVAKLRIGGLDWLDGDTLRDLVAHDNLRKAVLGDAYSPVGKALVAHGWVFAPMAWATVVVELGAPVALLSRRWAIAWSGAAWTFHAGILLLMAVVFPYQLLGVAFLPALITTTATPRSPRSGG